MPFLTELVIRPVNGDEWELAQPLHYKTLDGEEIVVPVGFQMDLASIPRIFTPIFPVHGKHTRAAVVHDWLYANYGHVPAMRIITRKECDTIFLEAMKELGVGWFKRSMMYAAVRSGGWLAWSES